MKDDLNDLVNNFNDVDISMCMLNLVEESGKIIKEWRRGDFGSFGKDIDYGKLHDSMEDLRDAHFNYIEMFCKKDVKNKEVL